MRGDSVMIKNLQDTVLLNNGKKMPGLGLGVFQIPNEQTATIVSEGIKAGYRLIDTAAVYGNEEGTGQGIKEGLAATGLSREDLFITSKVWNAGLDYEETLIAFEDSLNKLGLTYIDLYLIHWPGPDDQYIEVYKALEHLYEEGKIKAIGVSNFEIHHLEKLLLETTVKPVVNQVELHPRLNQQELQAFCAANDILIEAWSPLMQGKILKEPVLQEIAENHHRSVAQIVLRWDIQHEIIVLTKSVKTERLISNAALFDFELTEAEIQMIDELDQHLRVGPDPDTFDFK